MLRPSELRERRRDLGLTQAALARALGVAENTIARWERGDLRIARPQLVSLALAGLRKDALAGCPQPAGDDVDRAIRVAEAAERAMFSPTQGQWIERLEEETDRMRHALRTCVEQGDVQRGLWLAGTLWPRWYQTTAMAEGRAWLTEFLARDEARAPTRGRAQALYAAAILAGHQAEPARALALGEESLALWRRIGEAKRVAMLANVVAIRHRERGEIARSVALFEEGLAVARGCGERGIEALLLGNLVPSLVDAGKRDEARRALRDVIAMRREIGDPYGLSHSLTQLGHLALEDRDPLSAERHFREAREASPANAAFGAAAAHGLALAACDSGRIRAATDSALLCVRLARSIGSPITLAEGLDALAAIDARQGQHERALRFARAAELLREGLTPLTPRATAERDRRLASARAAATPPAHIDVAQVIAEAEALGPAHRRVRSPFETLTEREREVAHLVASGASNKEIAARLGIGVRTVESHLERVRRKADARSRSQLAALVGRDLAAPLIP